MKKHPKFYFFLFYLLGILLPILLNAQTAPNADNLSRYSDAAVVWRGFNHQWSYNHRINRLGNYIENTPFVQFPYAATAVHTSATGVGGDVGLFDAHYSYVAMEQVAVQSGVVSIEFSGKEGDMHHITKHLLIDSKAILDPKQANCTVVLNGFDVLSGYKADKVSLFSLSVGEAAYLPAVNKIRFDLSASLEVRCQSFECSRFNQKFNYTIDVYYLIFSQKTAPIANKLPLEVLSNKPNITTSTLAPDSSHKPAAPYKGLGIFYTSEQAVRRIYNWDKQEELDMLPERHIAKGINNNIYPEALLAFKSISLQLDRAHWLLDWHSSILPEEYDPESGTYQYSLDLLFKQWDEEMKHHSANPRISRFSSKRRGWAILEANVCLLQFSNAFVRHADTQGIVKWEGRNQSADANASVQRFPLSLNDSLYHSEQTDLYQQRSQQNAQIKQQYEQYAIELEKKRQRERKNKQKP
jgi:hypothetical protein